MLRHFQNKGSVKLDRGTVEITDMEKLRKMTRIIKGRLCISTGGLLHISQALSIPQAVADLMRQRSFITAS